MELLELKSIWNQIDMTQISKQFILESEVSFTIRSKSNTVISRLNRAMKFKTWKAGIIGVFALLLSPVFALQPDDSFLLDNVLSPLEMSVMLFLMGGLTLSASYLNWKNHKKIMAFQRMTKDLKSTLSQIVPILEKAQNIRINSDAYGVPFFGTWLAYAKLYMETGFEIDMRLFFLVMIAIILAAIAFQASKKVNSSYQQYIFGLKDCLSELESKQQ